MFHIEHRHVVSVSMWAPEADDIIALVVHLRRVGQPHGMLSGQVEKPVWRTEPASAARAEDIKGKAEG